MNRRMERGGVREAEREREKLGLRGGRKGDPLRREEGWPPRRGEGWPPEEGGQRVLEGLGKGECRE